MKPIFKIIATTMATCLFIGSTQAATAIRIAHDSQESSPLHQGLLHFKEELNKRSNGDFAVDIYPAGQLGGVRETTEMVQQNNLQMTTAASVLMSPYVPEFNVLDLFYLFDNREQAHQVLDGEAGQALLDAMESKGFHGIGYMELGFRSFTNSSRPLNSLEDFSGLKIRSAANPSQISAWRAIGAAPQPLAWGEIYTSLQQGLIQGQESALLSVHTQRFFEAQKYLSLTEHMYSNHVWFTNKEFWDNLSDEQQSLINEVAQEAITLQRELSEQQNQETVAILKKAGMEVNVVNAETRAQLKEKLNNAIESDIRSKTGDALYQTVLNAIAGTR
uniref:TRAP transporter substrate-binding protein n=1 Tax=Marinobacterium profundum TaxID=1714300 RepID=UPI000832CCF8|nr:TRAP transporter substrate-binding protein [Marinobacterium profundum]